MLGIKMEESVVRDIIVIIISVIFDVKLDDILNKDSVGYINGVSDEIIVYEYSFIVVGVLFYEIFIFQNDLLFE